MEYGLLTPSKYDRDPVITTQINDMMEDLSSPARQFAKDNGLDYNRVEGMPFFESVKLLNYQDIDSDLAVSIGFWPVRDCEGQVGVQLHLSTMRYIDNRNHIAHQDQEHVYAVPPDDIISAMEAAMAMIS